MSAAFRTRPSELPNFVDHSVGREEVSIEAMSLIGVPYRWAGNTPASGFDCSGLVQYVLGRAANVKLPRTTADMSNNGQAIEPDEIAAGDLVFFNTTGRPHSHVGIYVGKLRFVNAPSTGGTVRLDYLTNPYWAKRFDGIRRVAPARERPTPFDAPTYLATPREMPSEPGPWAAAPVRAREIAAQDSVASDAPPVMPANRYESPHETGRSDTGAPAAGSAIPFAQSAPPFPKSKRDGAEDGAKSASDAIDAAADAFEPRPPAAAPVDRRQTRQAAARSAVSQTPPGIQDKRAPQEPGMQPTPTESDDPIAQFTDSVN